MDSSNIEREKELNDKEKALERIDDLELKVVKFMAQNNELRKQYQEFNESISEKSIDQQEKEFQELKEQQNKLHYDIFNFIMNELIK